MLAFFPCNSCQAFTATIFTSSFFTFILQLYFSFSFACSSWSADWPGQCWTFCFFALKKFCLLLSQYVLGHRPSALWITIRWVLKLMAEHFIIHPAASHHQYIQENELFWKVHMPTPTLPPPCLTDEVQIDLCLIAIPELCRLFNVFYSLITSGSKVKWALDFLSAQLSQFCLWTEQPIVHLLLSP